MIIDLFSFRKCARCKVVKHDDKFRGMRGICRTCEDPLDY